ncbi:odorant receptor 13a-like [Cotesia glomerata]|uniref:odorant receptor 13a-like n=1 Tax=Cotesia glomerata TaxID=32391 RepID=UPI001D01E7AE|nr:odorant receptor 13a-like [Cotesia glomerata]
MEITVEKQFEESKLMIKKIGGLIQILNAWPINQSRKKLTMFMIYLSYETIYLSMAFNDVVSIFGSLQLMTANFLGTLVQLVMVIRLIFIRFSVKMKEIIEEIFDNCDVKNYPSKSEKEIYIKYYLKAKNFYIVTMTSIIIAAFGFCLLPLQKYIISWLLNYPATLEIPYRVKLFNSNGTSYRKTILLYIFELPLPVTAIGYIASINLQFVIISNICARIAILAKRIKNINCNSGNKTESLIKHIVLKHVELIKLIHRVNETCTPMLFVELLIWIPLLALVLFSAIVALEANETVAFLMLFNYICAALACLFANCLMGEILLTEHKNLQEMFYVCKWEEMSNKSRRSWLVCMSSGANIPMQITAGKIYIFSFNGFTGILRSSMAYVSLLRTLTA